MSNAGRLFAVVPAAGHSRRMGRPKLLLNLAGKTVLAKCIEALKGARIEAVHVVVRGADEPLQQEVKRCGARLVVPDVDPPEMRTSVEHALRDIEQHWRPRDQDGWLLVPADHPTLSKTLVAKLAETWRTDPTKIVLPQHKGKRGHPTIFPWSTWEEVKTLPADQGLNQIVRKTPSRVREVEVDRPDVLFDLDTPEDYARLRERFG